MSPAASSLANFNTSVLGLIVICGATATGKSALAIALAEQLFSERLNSVILSADSRQVYREFNIGTAKPSIVDQRRVPHYLIDICDPTETLTVAEYQMQAQGLIEGRGNERQKAEGRRQKVENLALSPSSPTPHSPLPIPLLVGGTGLYIRSITKGLKIPRVPPQPQLRSQLQSLGQAQCYALLQQVDSAAAQKIHANDAIRTLRSLEVFYVTGQPISQQQGEHPPPYPILHIGLDCRDADRRQQRIAHRTKQMVADGFIPEVEYLCQKYGAELPLLNTLGYAEFKQFLAGEISQTEAIAATILHTRQFAKRQRTWFRADPEIEWFDADNPDLVEQVWRRVKQFVGDRWVGLS